jgi:TonB family protein
MMHILIILLFSSFISAQTDSTISYYENGSISSIIRFNKGVRDGDASFYWENGNKKEELTYINGRVEGLVRRYYQNGNLNEMFVIQNGRREGPTSLFDSLGNYVEDIFYEEGILVVDKLVLDDGKYSKVLASNNPGNTKTENKPEQKKKQVSPDDPLPPVIEENHNYEDDPAFYQTVEVMPEPVGGMEAIYKKLHYPKTAKENGIQGTVIIMVYIDRTGEVIEANVVKGIDPACDESARLAVYYHRFDPGMQRGQRVKVQMEIPVEFKLPVEEVKSD